VGANVPKRVKYYRRDIGEIDAFLEEHGLSSEGTESERRQRAKHKRANLSPSAQRRMREFDKSPKRKEQRRKLRASPRGRAISREYSQRPEVKARNAKRMREKRALERATRPVGKIGQMAKSIHEVAKTPRYRIVAVKASEFARSRGSHRSKAEDYQKASKWFDSLDDNTRVDLEGKFARRRGAVDKRIVAFLKKAKVSEDDIAKFLSGGIEYHHFDEIVLGTKSVDKFFSGANIDKNLHQLIHKNLAKRYATELRPRGTPVSERLQGLLKSGDETRPSRLGNVRGLLHHTSEIQNYDPFRKGTVPPYLRIIAENAFGKKEAKRILDEALYISQGTDTPSHSAGERVKKNFKPSRAIQALINKGFSPMPLAWPAALAGGGLIALSPEDSTASMVGEGLLAASDPLTMALSGQSKTRNPNYMGLLSEQERRMVDPTWEADTAVNIPRKKKNIWN
tara:strand:- start:41 stop:1399 length:1359 start_codon:yes stop_codon:yes gene_type:complete